MVWVKVVLVVLSLSIDTLLVSISLGTTQRQGMPRWRLALSFSLAEAAMPLVGLGVGKWMGYILGIWASLASGLALLGLSLWFLFFQGEEKEERKLGRNLVGWTLVVTALSISADEFAVGFSIGLMDVPVFITILLIALQAFLFTVVGLTLGRTFASYLGEWSEKVGGAVLGGLGLWLSIVAVSRIW